MKTELEKIQDVNEKSQECGAFLEWLIIYKNYSLAQFLDEEDELVPVHVNVEALLAEYFKIDLIKAEKERSELLKQIRGEQ